MDFFSETLEITHYHIIILFNFYFYELFNWKERLMKVELTGNPFVDQGLYVLSYLAHKDGPNDLSIGDLAKVYGDGSHLAHINSRLKSFTMVFGTNGPLTQSGYRPKGNKKVISDKNIAAYTRVLDSFLATALCEDKNQELCEICGCNHVFDFDKNVRQALTKAGVQDKGKKTIGRDWFPLAGSLGNDAQSLPSASRGLNICPVCLFAVHYMPQALMLMKGKLVCFQSNEPEIAMELTETIVDEYVGPLNATSTKIELIGAKEGTSAMVRRLLTWMRKRQASLKNNMGIEESVSLRIWLFTNGGTNPDCEILEIPNRTLQFLWQAQKLGFGQEIINLLKNDSKIADFQFLACAQEGRDYFGLYPYKKFPGVSSELFALYQQTIIGITNSALKNAQQLAARRLGFATVKERQSLQKSGYIDGESGKRERQQTRKMMIEMEKKGEFSLDDYSCLFPTISHHPIRVDSRGWKIISYYFSHPADEIPDFLNTQAHILDRGDMSNTHPKVGKLAQLYFDDYVKKHGIKHFEKHILDRFQKTYPNSINWLREMFIRFAKDMDDFSYKDWDEFVLDGNGNPQTFELVFQMRLELANKFREFNVQKG